MQQLILWGVLGVVLIYAIVVFNRLVAARNACRNARASIDVNLTRRHDLIPNLVRSVRAYSGHERATLDAVTQARSQAIQTLGTARSASAEASLSQALDQLVVRVEAYPQLQAEGPFLQLMKNLTEAEEQISAARRAFNAQVMAMNNLVQQFPTLIVARLCGFKSLKSYQAVESARQAPAVNLSRNGGGLV